MSEDDLRAYQQASNGMLQNAASAAGNWLSDNWEYIAAGAMVAAGVAVMCTGVGGPIGAAMMAGALTSAGGSIWSQKSANGTVDWGTVLRDGAVGAATGLIGGGASAAAARATAGMTSCLGKNILTGAVEGAIDGGAGNGLQYLTSGQPITPAGFARAVGQGAGQGALGGGAGGALSHVTGIARYGCFTPDTPVLMADGSTKRIDQVQAGEQVLAHNPTTGQDEPATVEQTFVHEKVPTLRVTTTSGTVETTATHPFHVQGRGYTPAEQLREGDTLHTPDGHTTTVVSIQATGRTETVHNLAITGHHNYHVATTTGQPILVHNNTNPSGCGPENTGTEGFTPPEITVNDRGELTNGKYTIDAKGMEPHKTGSYLNQKSQFRSDVDAEKVVLDGAAYADEHDLWEHSSGSSAHVPTDVPVGYNGRTGEPSSIVNVYRTRTNYVHGSPGRPDPN